MDIIADQTAFEDLELGMTAEVTHNVSQQDVERFAELVGDYNPLHLNEPYARGTIFKGRIAHGMLTVGYISAVFGMKLPGPGAIYVSQTFNFRAPVYPGDAITARVEVVGLYPEKSRVKFACECLNQNGKTVLSGEAILMVPARAAN